MHKFKVGNYFMHKNNMDVCYEVLESHDIGDGYTVLANVINLGYVGSPFTLLNDNKFFIPYEESPFFIELTEKQFKTKRTKSGLPE